MFIEAQNKSALVNTASLALIAIDSGDDDYCVIAQGPGNVHICLAFFPTRREAEAYLAIIKGALKSRKVYLEFPSDEDLKGPTA